MTQQKAYFLSLLFLGLASYASGVRGEAAAPASEEQEEKLLKSGADWSFVVFPEGTLYPADISAPQRPAFGVQLMSFSSTEIFNSGTSRYGLKLGGRFGFFRIHPKGKPDRGLQLDIIAGFNGQFDRRHSSDSIGWDGIYGLMASYRTGEAVAMELGVLHTSSHIGDEYAERTGRLRINYTREELVAGVSWSMAQRWRTYGEVGWGYELGNKALQEPGRLQLGLEYERREVLGKQRMGWYVAGNGSATEERDWSLDHTAQIGLSMKAGERHWRLGLEYYNGRSLIGEFFQDDESYTALGLWLDL